MSDKEKYDALKARIINAAVTAASTYWTAKKEGKREKSIVELHTFDVLCDIIPESEDDDFLNELYAAFDAAKRKKGNGDELYFRCRTENSSNAG